MALDFSKMKTSKKSSHDTDPAESLNDNGVISQDFDQDSAPRFFDDTGLDSDAYENEDYGSPSDIESEYYEEPDSYEEFYEETVSEFSIPETSENDSENDSNFDFKSEFENDLGDDFRNDFKNEDGYGAEPDLNSLDEDDPEGGIVFIGLDQVDNTKVSKGTTESTTEDTTDKRHNDESSASERLEKESSGNLLNESSNDSQTVDDMMLDLLSDDEETEFYKKRAQENDRQEEQPAYNPPEEDKVLETRYEKAVPKTIIRDHHKKKNEDKKKAERQKKRVTNKPASMETTIVRTVDVDENGIPKYFKNDIPRKSTDTKKKGRLSEENIDHFSNLYISGRASDTERQLEAFLKTPAGMKESTRERRERERRIKSVLSSENIFQEGNKFNFTSRDKEVLEFLAIFKYATTKQLSYLRSNAERTVATRLSKLLKKGLVKKKTIYGAKPIWYNTKLGMMLSGYDLKHMTDQSINITQMKHQFVVNHVAANLWGANMNVLEEDDFPKTNRIEKNGEKILGEMLTSESELLSEFAKIKNFRASSNYKTELLNERESAFSKWRREGLKNGELPPQFEVGNEWMWVIIPPHSPRMSVYHVPDLVVKRPPEKDGTPNAVAVEIELMNKDERAYYKILSAYQKDFENQGTSRPSIYSKVVWVCHTLGTARKLEKVAKEMGLLQTGLVSIIPIIVDGGPYVRGDLWDL